MTDKKVRKLEKKRLIDADDFEKFFRTLESAGAGDYSTDGIISMLEKQPTVDAVEVVRCGKCKHTDDVIYQDHEDQVWCQRAGYWKDNDWYCADGERRSDETD